MMKPIQPSASWPVLWKESYDYDRQEIFGHVYNFGYSYGYWCNQQHIFEAFQQFVSLGSTVLDVAAAQGNYSLLLAEKGYQVVWNDIRSDLVDYVKQKYSTGKIDFVAGDVFKCNFSRKFDAILCSEIIEHVAHPDLFVKQISELLVPGGILILTTPSGEYFRNSLPRFSDYANPSDLESRQFMPNSDGHLFLLYEDEIRRFFSGSGLKVKKLEFYLNPLTNGWLKTEILLRYLPKKIIDFFEKVTAKSSGRFFKKLNNHVIVVAKKS